MTERIILGITQVQDLEHVVTGRYSPKTTKDTPELVEVIEVANSRLAHTAVEGGNPLGRMAVFSRLISSQELGLRKQQLAIDPHCYEARHLKGL